MMKLKGLNFFKKCYFYNASSLNSWKFNSRTRLLDEKFNIFSVVAMFRHMKHKESAVELQMCDFFEHTDVLYST